MATIEEFNAIIERAKLKTNFSAVVWTKRTDALPSVTSVQKRKNMIFVFRQVIAWNDTDHAAIIANGRVMAIWHALPAGRGELAGSVSDAPESVTAANLRQALHEAATGQTEPVATLWDEVEEWEPDADTPHWQARQWLEAERRTLQARLARAEAALAPFARIGAVLRKMSQPHLAWNGHVIGVEGEKIGLADLYAAVKALADEQPAPKMTRHYVTVMPSIGDKVRIKKDREQEADALAEE